MEISKIVYILAKDHNAEDTENRAVKLFIFGRGIFYTMTGKKKDSKITHIQMDGKVGAVFSGSPDMCTHVCVLYVCIHRGVQKSHPNVDTGYFWVMGFKFFLLNTFLYS